MPKWWKDRAEHIRERNPNAPEGLEWALATEQYKEKFGHPPRRHKRKSSIEENMNTLITLADTFDEKGLYEEASILDGIVAQLLPSLPPVRRTPAQPRPSRPKFDRTKIPSVVKEQILDNPVFKAAIVSDDFPTARDLALSAFMEAPEVPEEDKQRFLHNVRLIEESEGGPSAKELQKYMYNSYLKYLGLGVVTGLVERLLVFADSLDEKGLFSEADKISELITHAEIQTGPEACPNCGTMNSEFEMKCTNCGKELPQYHGTNNPAQYEMPKQVVVV